jgi:hypothetical protein
MFPTMSWFIWPSSFRRQNVWKLTNQKQELQMAVHVSCINYRIIGKCTIHVSCINYKFIGKCTIHASCIHYKFIGKCIKKLLDTFQHKCLRKILRIYWPMKTSNEEVRKAAGVAKNRS